MIDIGTSRQCFFDTYLTDEAQTTASILLHHPTPADITMTLDMPWEGDGSDFFNFFYDDGIYRMYYLGWQCQNPQMTVDTTIRVCYAQSTDGIHYTRPDLGICEYEGSKNNNIILDDTTMQFDNFYVFKDSNPRCSEGEKYKALALDLSQNALVAFYSNDAIHFTKGDVLTDKGAFDTLNTAFWDEDAQKYRCYLRGFHVPGDLEYADEFDEKPLLLEGVVRNKRIRDIRYMESPDFKNWTRPVHLDFGDKPDIPLYTNVVSPYMRAPHILVGFPTRYAERPEWTPAFDVLCGKDARKQRYERSRRSALTVTDCIFMTSRDGTNFTRYDEAFIRPGAEHQTNWVYGSCYPSVGMIETPSALRPDCDSEISMFCYENHMSGKPAQLRRYTIRADGFCSVHAGAREQILVTKPFVFDGNKLFANISTSAMGYMYFELICDGETITGYEMFGDSTEKPIMFEKDISRFRGKETVMKVRMSDADLYSFRFE